MRSLKSRGASETKRSGGIQGKSRWQSAEIRRYSMAFPPGARAVARRCSVEPQIGDVARIGLELAAFDLVDDLGQGGVGAGGKPDARRLLDDEAVQEIDLGAAPLHHVLAHRGPLLGREILGAGEQMVGGLRQRRGIALA